MSTRDIQIRKASRPALKPEGVSTEAFLAEEDNRIKRLRLEANYRAERRALKEHLTAKGTGKNRTRDMLAELRDKYDLALLDLTQPVETPVEPYDPDDSRYKPVNVDALLRGPARATGATAKAVRRSKALTRSDWAEITRRDT